MRSHGHSCQPKQIPVGGLLRTWRERRRLSQLELAGAADISARHISFLETGRSAPSRGCCCGWPSAWRSPCGSATLCCFPRGTRRCMPSADWMIPPYSRHVRRSSWCIAGHAPYPALAVDRHWTLVSANAVGGLLLAGIEPRLLEPPVNVLRLGMHPEGLGPRVENYAQWREHTLTRLRQQIAATADPILIEMLAELESYPRSRRGDGRRDIRTTTDYGGVVVPFTLRTDHGVLSFFSTTTVFGTPLDITLAELAIESFFPADPKTAETLTRIARCKRFRTGAVPMVQTSHAERTHQKEVVGRFDRRRLRISVRRRGGDDPSASTIAAQCAARHLVAPPAGHLSPRRWRLSLTPT